MIHLKKLVSIKKTILRESQIKKNTVFKNVRTKIHYVKRMINSVIKLNVKPKNVRLIRSNLTVVGMASAIPLASKSNTTVPKTAKFTINLVLTFVKIK